MLVFVDDAHLLDSGSAVLVHQMALTKAAIVVATVRAGEVLPDPVLSLWKDGPAERIEIGVLSDETIEELLASALEGPVDAASGASAGSAQPGQSHVPARAGQRCARDRGPRGHGGPVAARGRTGPHGPIGRVNGVASGRPESIRAIGVGATRLGRPLGPVELSHLTDPAAVDALEEKGLVISGTQGARVEVRLAHPVYGDVIVRGISARREQAISRSLAEVIEAVGVRRQPDPLKVATLRLVGGGGSAELLVSGATVARAATTTPSPNASPGRPSRPAPGSRPVSWEQRPPISSIAPTRPSRNWPRWPHKQPATPRNAEWLCCGSTIST